VSNDAENRASAVLLPGQELVVAAKEPPADVGISSTSSGAPAPSWFPSAPSSWDFGLSSSVQAQLQTFDVPLAPMTYWVSQNITREGFFLRVFYVDGSVEMCDTAERVANYIDRFETPNITAEMDYSMGNLTILSATLPIQQISIQYKVQLPERLL